jgi:hypothetical protein
MYAIVLFLWGSILEHYKVFYALIKMHVHKFYILAIQASLWYYCYCYSYVSSFMQCSLCYYPPLGAPPPPRIHCASYSSWWL